MSVFIENELRHKWMDLQCMRLDVYSPYVTQYNSKNPDLLHYYMYAFIFISFYLFILIRGFPNALFFISIFKKFLQKSLTKTFSYTQYFYPLHKFKCKKLRLSRLILNTFLVFLLKLIKNFSFLLKSSERH